MHRVIVIGGSGFLGSRVLQELVKRGYRVFATQNKNPLPVHAQINPIEGGIAALTAKKIREINPLTIFHCARPTFPRLRKWGRWLAAEKARRLNKQLLHEIKESGLSPGLLFAAGSLSYGNGSVAHDERSPLNPLSYARQYLRGERPFLKNPHAYPHPVLVLRFPWLLGDGSWFSWFYLKNIRHKKPIPQFGNGENHLSIIDANDAAQLMVLYAEKGIGGGVYNIFSPQVYNQKEFLELVRQQFGCEIADYTHLYGHKIEKAALEAFYSNILLTSKYMDILNEFPFTTIPETLKKISSQDYF